MSIQTTLLYEQLKHTHVKITACRKAMIETLKELDHPFTAYELLKLLEQKHKIHRATVYRDLACFVEAGIVKELSLIGIPSTYYEVSFLEHHHHCICQSCHTIIDIDTQEAELPLRQIEQRLNKQGFHVQEHNVKFYGTCQTCWERSHI